MKATTRQALVGAAIGSGLSLAVGVTIHFVIRREVKKAVAIKKAEAVKAAQESPLCAWV